MLTLANLGECKWDGVHGECGGERQEEGQGERSHVLPSNYGPGSQGSRQPSLRGRGFELYILKPFYLS